MNLQGWQVHQYLEFHISSFTFLCLKMMLNYWYSPITYVKVAYPLEDYLQYLLRIKLLRNKMRFTIIFSLDFSTKINESNSLLLFESPKKRSTEFDAGINVNVSLHTESAASTSRRTLEQVKIRNCYLRKQGACFLCVCVLVTRGLHKSMALAEKGFRSFLLWDRLTSFIFLLATWAPIDLKIYEL